jgi:hypothetical protein
LSTTGMCGTIFYGSMSPSCGLLSARLFTIV